MKKLTMETPMPEIIKGFSINRKKIEENLLIESIRKLNGYVPLPSESEKKEKSMRYLVREWFSQKMEENYKEVSSGVLAMESEIEIDLNKFDNYTDSESKIRTPVPSEVKIKIPLLARAELGYHKGWEHNYRHMGEAGSKYNEYKIKISSPMPKVPQKMREAGKEALARVYEIYGEALRTETLGDIILANEEYAPNPKYAKLLVVWKPRADDLHIEVEKIDKDPALILDWHRTYLVGLWEEPNEDPFWDDLPMNPRKSSNLDDILGN